MTVNVPKIKTVVLTLEERQALENALDILEELNALIKPSEILEVGDEDYEESFINDCVVFLEDVIGHYDDGNLTIVPLLAEQT